MRNDKENLIVKLMFDFAIEIFRCSKILQESDDCALSNQLLRAGISIGANVKDAQNAWSKADFIHKMNIAKLMSVKEFSNL
ncbi:MAG: four helix bundle protein [Sphingobacterium thalpophilum]|jgi:four helix bundle protein